MTYEATIRAFKKREKGKLKVPSGADFSPPKVLWLTNRFSLLILLKEENC
jgi:hypothetical protein